MSTNGGNIAEDADMAECDEEKVVTMMDVLQEQQEFEDDANAVLGASDDKNCTYAKGYIKRQAIYACLTCCVEAKIDPTKRAGVCLACSLNCHENHELIELYTKRNFRCDCGNPKFNKHPCQFTPEKSNLNEDNNYNQNFSGLYCTCHRPYPDPEAAFEDEMIQCIVCEDWLHSAHLETNLPTNDYAEMVCKACMDKNEFLHSYSDIAVNSESEDVDILSVNNDISVVNKSTESNDIIEKVNGEVEDTLITKKDGDVDMGSAEAVIEKVESLTTDNPGVAPKSDNLADSTTDNNIDKAEDAKAPVMDTSDTTDQINDSKSESTIENNVTSNINDIEDDKKVEERSKECDQSNENSIIESIEKLENELGNVKPEEDKDTSEETVDTNKTDLNEDISTQEKSDKTSENLESNFKDNSNEDDNEKSIEDKNNDINIKDDNTDKAGSESSVTDDSNKKEALDMSSELKDSETKMEENTKDVKRKLSTEEIETVNSKKPKIDDTSCVRPKGVKKRFKGATFWPSNFRQKLCTCTTCISMYKDLSVLFLTDSDDTVTAYEALGRQKIDGTATSQYEKGLEALTSLDRIQQINALTEYNKMRDKLLDYLKSFKERKEVVKEQDIKAFFAGMKPKRESDGVYFCR